MQASDWHAIEQTGGLTRIGADAIMIKGRATRTVKQRRCSKKQGKWRLARDKSGWRTGSRVSGSKESGALSEWEQRLRLRHAQLAGFFVFLIYQNRTSAFFLSHFWSDSVTARRLKRDERCLHAGRRAAGVPTVHGLEGGFYSPWDLEPWTVKASQWHASQKSFNPSPKVSWMFSQKK